MWFLYTGFVHYAGMCPPPPLLWLVMLSWLMMVMMSILTSTSLSASCSFYSYIPYLNNSTMLDLSLSGAAKPALVCATNDAMELRRMSYTSWVTTLNHLTPGAMKESKGAMGVDSSQGTCHRPEPLIANYSSCVRHLPGTYTHTFSPSLPSPSL